MFDLQNFFGIFEEKVPHILSTHQTDRDPIVNT